MRQLLHVLNESFTIWRRPDIRELGAAIAFYAGVSLVPLLLTIAAVAGIIFSPQEVENEIVSGIRDLVGQNAAQGIRDALQNINGENGFMPTITAFNVVVMLLAATNLFRHLKGALNTIWEVEKPKSENLEEQVKQEVKNFMKTTLVSLVMVGVIGIALLFWLVGSTLLFYYVRSAWNVLGYGFMFLIMTATFSVLYKTMPDPDLQWRDVTVGAVITALLFLLGQSLIIAIIGQSSMDNLYGTASLLTFVLIWVYVSAQMVLFGAILTKVYAALHGSEAHEPKTSRTPQPAPGD